MNYSFEDIARYAEGEMSAEEQGAFDAALQEDTALQQQLALYKDVDSSLRRQWTRDAQRDQLQQTMQQLRGEFFTAQQGTTGTNDTAAMANTSTTDPIQRGAGKVVSFNKYLKVAVAVAAVLVIGLFVWQPWQSSPYEKYTDGLHMVSSTERGGDHVDSVMVQATAAFNNQDFVTATVMLAEVVQQDPGNSFAQLYFGISLMKTDKIIQARNTFAKLTNGESAFRYDAFFYQALTYLHKQDTDIPSAKEWLQKIPADAANYNKAQELLKKL